jgi:hypothetical protein
MNDDKNYQPVTVNGVTYLPMDSCTPIDDAKKFEVKARNLGCLPQRIKTVNTGGFFTRDFAVCVFLVPVDKIEAWIALSD